MKRRLFLRNSALSTLALTIPAIRSFGNNFSPGYNLPRRVLGKTGEKLSVIGFGGIMLNDNPQDFANELVAKSYELGVNYYDVAPGYGNAQERLGPALKPYRKNCFLACKTQKRNAAEAQAELEDSLRKLETDYFDLYQLHALSSVNEVEQVFAEAEKRGMGILALKAMALTRLEQGEQKLYKNVWYRPVADEEVMKMALKYTLSKNITAAVPPGQNTLFLKALEFMNDYQPITDNETQKLLTLAKTTKPVFMHS